MSKSLGFHPDLSHVQPGEREYDGNFWIRNNKYKRSGSLGLGLGLGLGAQQKYLRSTYPRPGLAGQEQPG